MPSRKRIVYSFTFYGLFFKDYYLIQRRLVIHYADYCVPFSEIFGARLCLSDTERGLIFREAAAHAFFYCRIGATGSASDL